MDPSKPESFNHRTELLSTGHTYHFVDQKPDDYDPKNSPTLLLIHGFPDFWYGWRYQIARWVEQGSRVVAPDMLGYGGTDKPLEPVEYSTKKLSADLVALLDLLGIQQAVVVGHDWGSFIAQRFALWHPERLSALILLSTAYYPPNPTYRSLQDTVSLNPNFGYQLYFNNQKSTGEIENNLHKFFSILYSPLEEMTPVGKVEKMMNDPNLQVTQSLLNEQELAYYLQEFSTGMNGPLNYYRTVDYRFKEEKEANLPSELRIDLPVLRIWGTSDPTSLPPSVANTHKFIKLYEDVALEGVNHWLMLEAKDVITEKISGWLKGLKGEGEVEPPKL